MNYILLFGMPGGGELFIIVLIIIMLFGSKKIPELARVLGKGIQEIKNATGDIQKEIRDGAKDIKESVDVEKKVKNLLDKEPETEKKAIDDFQEVTKKTDTIKRKSPYESNDSEKV